eukprot:scaffold29968_cov112-Isochrysis_galbana.AAC.2
MVSSYEHEASTSSLGCQTTSLTSCVCELSTIATSYSSSSACHTHTLLSRPHVAMYSPDGDHATDLTSLSWPDRHSYQRRCVTSAAGAVHWAAHAAVGQPMPSARAAPAPSSEAMQSNSPFSHFQIIAVLSNEHDANSVPHGAHETRRTVRSCPSSRMATHSQPPRCGAHKRMARSAAHEATVRLVGDHATCHTHGSLWPRSVATHSNGAANDSSIVGVRSDAAALWRDRADSSFLGQSLFT